MRRTLLALAAFAPLALAQTQTVSYTYSGLPLPLYPDDWNVVSVVRIFVPRALQITKVTAAATVQFAGTGDLNVFLYSPAGTRTKLLERNCGSLVNIDATFDDAAPSKFSDACPQAGTGTSFRGNEPLSNSNGEVSYGYWRLAVENNGSSKTGTVSGFTITVTGTTLGPPAIGQNTIVSTTSFSGGQVAPGDQVSILGFNLGPGTGVRADATTTLPTSLSGTSVTFDGVAVPLFYVSANYIAAQAPTGLSIGSNTSIKVTSSSGTSGTVTLPVVPANPGLFTVEAGGTGQARAVNQDGTQNGDGTITGSDTPAPRGSVVAFYASGLGAVTPAVAAGTPTPNSPLSTVNLPVTATIAGQPATVTYAGLAPGQIGVYQVNVLVPVATPSGTVRVVLTAGGNSSPGPVTIQIK
ncbi:MAG TPA: proprotein convertase P-domain-containing protein [Candidatus Acidoferrales bacterium]|nr:proprotein convertase P-domain-containing protein [Candidatus Acidoferrales bacterium]